VRLGEGLFGRHERRSAEHQPRSGGLGPADRGVSHASDAEIENLKLAFPRDEEIRRLNVPVNNRLGVRRGENIRKVVPDGQRRAERNPSTMSLPEMLDRVAVEKFHHEERSAIVCHVVVENGDCPRMIDRVGGVALPEKPRANILPQRELRVQHLDRETLLIAVRRCVHHGHPPDSEHAIEAVLAA
jgi:hypothetical protein